MKENSFFLLSNRRISTSSVFLTLFATSSLLSVIAVLFDLSLIVIPAGTISVLLVLFLSRPLALLSLLVVVRMSLDIFGSATSISFGENFALSFSQALGIGVALFGTIARFLLRKNLSKPPLITPLLTVLLWGFFSMIISIDTSATAQELLRVFDLLLLFTLAFVAVKTRDDFRILLIAFFVSSVIPVCAGIFQYMFDIGFRDESVSIPRIFGTFSHPNIFSLFLFSLIAISTVYFLLFAKTSREKLFIGTITALYAVVLFLTYTRIAWITLFAFLLLLALFHFRKFLLPLLILPFVLFLAIAPFQERILDSFRASPDSSVTWRIELWKDTVNTTVANGDAFLGSGMNTFSIVSENIRGMSRGPSNDPHNDFVKFFVEGGIIGLSIYIFFIGSILLFLFREFKKSKDENRKILFLAIFGIFSSLALASLSDNVFKNTPIQWIFWITLGATLGLFSQTSPSEKEKSTIPVLQK